MNLGSAIKAIRVQSGKTQLELSKEIGLTQASLSLIEVGRKRPSEKNLNKICKALDVPVSIVYLLSIDDTDISDEKRGLYNEFYPTIRNIALSLLDKS